MEERCLYLPNLTLAEEIIQKKEWTTGRNGTEKSWTMQ
jgi:hypothetical protein